MVLHDTQSDPFTMNTNQPIQLESNVERPINEFVRKWRHGKRSYLYFSGDDLLKVDNQYFHEHRSNNDYYCITDIIPENQLQN